MLDLTWWQVLALLATAVVAVVGGRLIGHWSHRALYRRVLLSRSSADDRMMLRLGGPINGIAIVIVWQFMVGLYGLPEAVLEFCRSIGHIGLLIVFGWAALRLVDTGIELIAVRSTWITNQRVSQSLLPLARRIAKIVLVALVSVMVLARLGYSIGPLLVMLAVMGAAVALAAHRPLENVLAAYAILGDHGIREGDTVSLDNGTIGTIEAIGLYSTRLRTLDNTNVIVPNRKLADAQIERKVSHAPTRPLASVPPPDGDSTSAGGVS